MRTLLIAEYASWQAFEVGNPGTGRGKLVTTVRRAVAVMELSTEFWVVRLDSFSIRDGSISAGILSTNGPKLPAANSQPCMFC